MKRSFVIFFFISTLFSHVFGLLNLFSSVPFFFLSLVASLHLIHDSIELLASFRLSFLTFLASLGLDDGSSLGRSVLLLLL